MKWVTREHTKVDRVACPWLIQKFIDKGAEFLFVPADQVLETAKRVGGKSYDMKGADYHHQNLPEGEVCTFVTIMREHGLWGKDKALDEVAKIVNHADTSKETSAYHVPEGDGLNAIAHGFALVCDDDHQKLKLEFPMYDALYAYCQQKLVKGKS